MAKEEDQALAFHASMSALDTILARLPPEGFRGKTVRDLATETRLTQSHIRNCLKQLERENKVVRAPFESYDILRGGRQPEAYFLKTGPLKIPVAVPDPFASNYRKKPQNWTSPK